MHSWNPNATGGSSRASAGRRRPQVQQPQPPPQRLQLQGDAWDSPTASPRGAAAEGGHLNETVRTLGSDTVEDFMVSRT